jgi:hypothetical protein
MAEAAADDAARPRPAGATALAWWIPAMLAVATLAWLIAQLDRGLDLTDESFYLLSAMHASSIRLFFTPAHWVAGALWQATGDLVAFRALGLASSVLSALLLAEAVARVAPIAGMRGPQTAGERAAMLAASASGALLYGSLLNFTPSYNLLGASGACFAAALILFAITAAPRRAWMFEVLAGAALGITFLCKFSAAVCVGGILVALHAAFRSEWRLSWRRVPVWMIASAAVTVAIAISLETGFAEALRQFRAGVEIVWLAQRDKAVGARLARSAADIGGMVAGMATSYWGPLLCLLAARRWRPTLLAAAGLAWFAVVLLTGHGLSSGMTYHDEQGVPLAAALALAFVAGAEQWMRSGRAVVLVIALAVLPVAIALGTSNPLQIQILGALAPWGALIALLGLGRARTAWAAAVATAAFGFVVLMQVIGNGADPYRIAPLPRQTESITLPSLGTIKVDPATAAMARDLGAAARKCRIAAGAPFLDFYNVPGAALLIDAVPVDSPWLLDPAYAGVALRRADPATLGRAVIAVKLEPSGARPEPPPQLAGFPAGYRRCGRAIAPLDGRVVELWARG